MSYSLESVYLVRNELIRLIMKAGTKKENKWFFTNGSFLPEEQIERIPNTWNNDTDAERETKKHLEDYIEGRTQSGGK
ncbi:MAG: hypothetical protein IJZ71_00310 [Treponema sp.]|nr:hypothetical protein [Treponema sp.]